jgi:hypothetical protein
MLFIKPSEISGKIMTLLDESDQFALIVSPYVKISKWYKLLKKLESLKLRNITNHFIIRDDQGNSNSFHELDNLKISYFAIPNLHCKLYMNEKYAIVSSMNLLFSSEINSIELAYQTETESEYLELKTFSERHLGMNFDLSKSTHSSHEENVDWRDMVCEVLNQKLSRKYSVGQDGIYFNINTGKNNYSSSIFSYDRNLFQISGILTSREYEWLNSNKTLIPKIEGLTISIMEGSGNKYCTINGTLTKQLESKHVGAVKPIEAKLLAESFTNFILAVDRFK